MNDYSSGITCFSLLDPRYSAHGLTVRYAEALSDPSISFCLLNTINCLLIFLTARVFTWKLRYLTLF